MILILENGHAVNMDTAHRLVKCADFLDNVPYWSLDVRTESSWERVASDMTEKECSDMFDDLVMLWSGKFSCVVNPSKGLQQAREEGRSVTDEKVPTLSEENRVTSEEIERALRRAGAQL